MSVNAVTKTQMNISSFSLADIPYAEDHEGCEKQSLADIPYNESKLVPPPLIDSLHEKLVEKKDL